MDWQTLGLYSGATLLGAGGLQTLSLILTGRQRAVKHRRRAQLRRDEFRQRLNAELKVARAAKPIFKAWAGERTFRVAAIVDEAKGYKSFYLTPADGRPLPPFEPGQYLTFSLPVHADRKPIVRCYSLSERPREDYYRVTIKLATPPRDHPSAPQGIGSSFFHEHLKVGSSVGVQAPQGAFFLDPVDSLPIVLISGGVGITPILAMASAIVHERSERQVYWFAGFRNSSEHPCRSQMRELAEKDNIHCDISYSRPESIDRMGAEYHHLGHVTPVRLRQVLPSSNFRFYVCGPPAMMEQMVAGLRNWGVPGSHIHYEAFGPASIRTPSSSPTQPYQVQFANSNRQLTWKGEYPSLLDLAEAKGLQLESGCRAGSCGQCLLKLREGKVTHSKVPGVPLAEGECLACIAQPQGDLVVEA